MLSDTLVRRELAHPFPAILPAWAVPPAADDARHDYLLLKAALRQVLARCAGPVARRDFVATRKAYRKLCVQPWLHLPVRLPVRLSPYLLNDALHEIAALVDKPVRDAALRCIRRMRFAGEPASR